MRHLIIAAVATAAILSGCSGSDDSAAPEAEPTGSPTASATPTAPDSTDAGERPEDAQTDAGAIAFGEFAVRSVVATRGNADLDTFLRLGKISCTGCNNLADQIKDEPERVQILDSPPTFEDSELAGTDDEGEEEEYLTRHLVQLSAGKDVNPTDGSVIATFDASTLEFLVRMVWDDGQWYITNYSAEAPE